jgi:predicted nucleotidyltransferase
VTHQIQSLLQEFRRGLAAIYGRRLRGIYLYGSFARGEDDPESDLDLLIVLDHFDRYGAEVERTGELAAALSLSHGITISQVFLREEEWLHGDTPFLANVREEAIAA